MTEAILAGSGDERRESSRKSRHESDTASVRSYASTVSLIKSKFKPSRLSKAEAAEIRKLKAQVRKSA